MRQLTWHALLRLRLHLDGVDGLEPLQQTPAHRLERRLRAVHCRGTSGSHAFAIWRQELASIRFFDNDLPPAFRTFRLRVLPGGMHMLVGFVRMTTRGVEFRNILQRHSEFTVCTASTNLLPCRPT